MTPATKAPTATMNTALPVSDIEIARQATLRRITELARDRLGIADEHVIPYGHHKAKLSLPFVESLALEPRYPVQGALGRWARSSTR